MSIHSKLHWALTPILIASFAAPCASASVAIPPLDPAVVWDQFLSHAELETAYAGFAVLAKVHYDDNTVDATSCSRESASLAAAVAAAPVSIAIRRAAYLCADATGDNALAEQTLAALAAMSKYALEQSGDSEVSRPIRILAPVDASALVASTGLESAYQYYSQLRPYRFFPMVIAARDPKTKIERELVFDYVDTAYQLSRKSPLFGYPVLRDELADAFIDSAAKSNIISAIDLQLAHKAWLVDGPRNKIDILRPAASRGGLLSGETWLLLCDKFPFPGCADGLIEALLPQAEKQNAKPLMLLALAHLDGVGIKRDEGAAWELLDAADRHQAQGRAFVEFAQLWQDTHKNASVPKELLARLKRAEVSGNRDPRRMEIQRRIESGGKVALDSSELAFLSDPAENNMGHGYAELSDYYNGLGRKSEMVAWLCKASDAGWPKAHENYGFSLINAEDMPIDEALGNRVLAEAAHDGSARAMRYLAGVAKFDRRWRDAELWLLEAVRGGDAEAQLSLANLYEFEHPGVDGKADQALLIYKSLDQGGSAEARRRLSNMALYGRGMPKDPQRAKSLLLTDAVKGDHSSEALLGYGLLKGTFGAVNEVEGVQWMERALAAKEETAYSYGYWLFYDKGGAQAQARAIDIWSQGDAANVTDASNNLAWALCTSPGPRFDPKRGLMAALHMGVVDDLASPQLDTLAACLAASGNFQKAVEVQTRAVARMTKAVVEHTTAENQKDLEGYKDRLALYRSGKPYRKLDRS
jgi:TPR repeat protein